MSKVDSDFGEIYVCKYCGEDVGKFNEETGDHPQCEELAAKDAELSALRERVEALETVGKRMLHILPVDEIEIAREAWGNTNTRLILGARYELAAALQAP